MEEARARRRRNAAFIGRAAVFLVLFLVLACCALYVLTPKGDYGPGSMMNLYCQEEDTIDVLALGTSMTYAAVNTNVLWANWGIAAYDLACAEQQYWHTYYYLEEALKTQSPKLILLDAKAATYPDSATKRGRTVQNTVGIRDQQTRWRAVAASGQEDARGFFLSFPQVHENWKKLTAESFALPGWTGGRATHWKGYIEQDATEIHTKPSLVWTNIRKNLNEREVEWFGKICDLAEAHGIPILLVAYPNPDYASDHMYYNALWALADARGIPHINFNDPKGHYRFRYASEFADWQHLNTQGGLRLSKLLGAYLAEYYDLPDRRGGAAWQSWEDCLQAWQAAWPQYAGQILTEGSP